MSENLTAELRELFRSGASITQLLFHAQEQLGGETVSRRDLARAVWSAFGIGPSGWTLLGGTESFGTGTQPDWKLTMCFLREIMQRRSDWDTPGDEPRWYDGLEKRSAEEQNQLAAASFGGLSQEGWNSLSEADRATARHNQAMSWILSEDLMIYSAMIEQLQRCVNEISESIPEPAMAAVTN